MNKFLVHLLIILLITISQLVRSYNIRDLLVICFVGYINFSSMSNSQDALYHTLVVSILYIMFTLIIKKLLYTNEGFKSGKKKKKVKKAKKIVKPVHDSEDEDDEPFLDTKNTIMDIYKKLGPDELKGLNNDTKELMKTQKSLISTLETMGPVLEQGKDIMGSFNKYFGNDADLANLLKP